MWMESLFVSTKCRLKAYAPPSIQALGPDAVQKWQNQKRRVILNTCAQTPPKITEEHRLLAVSLFEQGKTMGEIAEACGVSRQTIVNRVKRWRELGLFPKATQSQQNQEPEQRDRGMVH
jgi:DNA-binding NarL/FixJ family response regulator